MDDDLPQLSITKHFYGVGLLLRRGASLSVSYSLSMSESDSGGPWLFTADFREADYHAFEKLTSIGPEKLTFEGVTQTRRRLRLNQVHWKQESAGRLIAEVHEIVLDAEPLDGAPIYQWILLNLTYTDVLLPEVVMSERFWTGEIKASDHPGSKKQPIAWNSDLGSTELSIRYEFDNIKVAEAKGLVRIPTPSLSLELSSECFDKNVEALGDRFVAAAEIPLRILSFLSRRHVRWKHMKVTSRWEGGATGAGYQTTEWWRTAGVADRRPKLSRMVNPHRMPHGSFNNMCQVFSELPFREAASNAIVYLVEVSQSQFLESRLVSAFTGLEALVAGIDEVNGSDKILGSSAFKALQKRLKLQLQEFGGERRLSDLEVQRMVDKLPEINRPPIVDRVEDLLIKQNVKWQDLWRPGKSLREGLKEAFSRRNLFIHTGHLSSPRQAHVDATRIHVLCERLLFQLLNGDPDWYDWDTYRHVDGVVPIEEGLV